MVHLDHINIRAPAELLQREKRFFCDIIGLREGPRPAFRSKGYWLYADDRPIVHLSQRPLTVPAGQKGHLDHVAFRSRGLHALLDRLDSAGIDYRTDYLDELRLTQVFLQSPSATGIEVNFVDEPLQGNRGQ
jgi:catechol 2,3-dioxygenase-like lactoylglutathione lyase family enzyme